MRFVATFLITMPFFSVGLFFSPPPRVGVMGSHAGMTKWGATDWKQHTSNALVVDVDTIPAVFKETPRWLDVQCARRACVGVGVECCGCNVCVSVCEVLRL